MIDPAHSDALDAHLDAIQAAFFVALAGHLTSTTPTWHHATTQET